MSRNIGKVLKSFNRFAIPCFFVIASLNAYALSTTNYGATADGTTDDTAALQQALTACSITNTDGIHTSTTDELRYFQLAANHLNDPWFLAA